MKKELIFAALVMILGIGLIAGGIFAACTKNNDRGHECRWKLCPYKGVNKSEWKQAVTNYLGEWYEGRESEGTDAWCIDMLHLEFPQDEYEQLEDKLFKPNK